MPLADIVLAADGTLADAASVATVRSFDMAEAILHVARRCRGTHCYLEEQPELAERTAA